MSGVQGKKALSSECLSFQAGGSGLGCLLLLALGVRQGLRFRVLAVPFRIQAIRVDGRVYG